jgi:multicomponent K+:H+ antiporter subunit G
MNEVVQISVLAETLTASFLVAGAVITLVGAFGLLRLRNFYQRVHAPTLGTTAGTACVTLASMIYFWTLGSRPVLHEVLILLFVTITTPITLMILVRAAAFRDKTDNKSLRPRTSG